MNDAKIIELYRTKIQELDKALKDIKKYMAQGQEALILVRVDREIRSIQDLEKSIQG